MQWRPRSALRRTQSQWNDKEFIMKSIRPFHHSLTRRSITAGLALAATLGAGAAQAALLPGDLVITEVLANPEAVSDTAGEWFEIYNASAADIDLIGFTLRDQGSNAHVVSGGAPLIVAPGEYFVFGRNGNALLNGGYSADYVYDSFVLGNSSDAIILERDGAAIASLVYANAALFGAAGRSAELTAAGFALTPTGYSFGSGDIGTPGIAGSYTPPTVSEVPVPAAGWLMLSALGALTARRQRTAANSPRR